MMYELFEAQSALIRQNQFMAKVATSLLDSTWPARNRPAPVARLAAAYELIKHTAITHRRLPFRIDTSRYGNQTVAVQEEVITATPFATLLRFAKEGARGQPKVLVAAPMSGHFATLLRGTVRVLLPDNDVYITDWHNGRDVPVAAGPFDFDDYIAHLMQFMELLGPGTHVVAVCQPTVPVLAAVALMAESGSKAQPRTMTLMAGPIDTRISPTKVNELANTKPISWFEKQLIAAVPAGLPGARRKVYPGFVQLMAFVSMNIDRHAKAHAEYQTNIVEGNHEKVAAHRAFYDEYMAVMDLPAEFYLQTVQRVFQEHHMPLGRMQWRGRRVNPALIRRTALFAVEGELDDICAIGQTMAALDLCVGLRPSMKRYHLQTGVGHYGVFNGRRWAEEIYPRIRTMIQAHSA